MCVCVFSINSYYILLRKEKEEIVRNEVPLRDDSKVSVLEESKEEGSWREKEKGGDKRGAEKVDERKEKMRSLLGTLFMFLS